jgi:hypothetical protein
MSRVKTVLLLATWLIAAATARAQVSSDPFPTPIQATDGVIAVKFVEFAAIPDVNGEAPRMMHLADEPGTKRMLVSTMRGSLYSVSY